MHLKSYKKKKPWTELQAPLMFLLSKIFSVHQLVKILKRGKLIFFILHLPYPEGSSKNDFIPNDLCSVFYTTVDDAVSIIKTFKGMFAS